MMRIWITTAIVLMTGVVGAQHELAFFNMDSLWSRNFLNPAEASHHNWTISLPEVYLGFNHSGDPFADILSVDDKTLVIDKDKWLSNLSDINTLYGRNDIPTLGIAHRFGQFTVSLAHQFRNTYDILYPKDMVELAVNGNASYIGQSLQIGPGIRFGSYSEFGLGLTWESSNLSVGGRFKYLNGIQYLESKNSSLSLFTDEDIYRLRFNTDYELISSSFINSIDLETLTFDREATDLNQWVTSNPGIALDLGVKANVAGFIEIEMALLDLGSINWKDNVKQFKSEGEFTYEGLDVDDLIDVDSLAFEEIVDSVKNILEFKEASLNSFTQTLPRRLYLAGQVRLNSQWKLSLLYSNETFFDESDSAYALGVRYQPFTWWSLGLTGANRFEDFNLGFSSRMNLGPIQIYGVSDNILGLFTLNELSNSNVRLGANVIF